jgi:hypothetical protein
MKRRLLESSPAKMAEHNETQKSLAAGRRARHWVKPKKTDMPATSGAKNA